MREHFWSSGRFLIEMKVENLKAKLFQDAALSGFRRHVHLPTLNTL